jgi:molybdopterin converting factor small subunit
MDITIEEGKRVRDVLRLTIERYPDLPLHQGAVLVTVNNQVTTLDRALEKKDIVSFIPHIGGG